MCKFSSKSGGVPFQPLGDLTWNDPKQVYKPEVYLTVNINNKVLPHLLNSG